MNAIVRGQMGRVLKMLLLALWLQAEFSVCSAEEISLEGGSTLRVTEIAFHRFLPHSFYDQAMSSLPKLFPAHELLASRRTGAIGEVIYALVCYKETQSSPQVVSQAIAVHGNRAWDIDTTAAPSYGDTLVQVIEQIGALPSNYGVQRPPASGRR